MKYTLSKPMLTEKIIEHFEDDAYYWVTEGQKEFDLYFEVKQGHNIYIIEGKYQYDKKAYDKDKLKCYRMSGSTKIEYELIIKPGYNPNKPPLIKEMDAIVQREENKQRERQRDQSILNFKNL